MENREKCANKMCTCLAAENSDYCSTSCANVSESELTQIQCECGHSGCGGEI